MKKSNKILLVGGGTGGHIVPIFNVYSRLKKLKPDQKIVVVGSGSPIEKIFFENNSDFVTIRVGKFRKKIDIWQFFLFLFSIFDSLFLLLRIKPRLVFSKGGYVALPIVIWAKLLHIPYLIHESDAVMGGTNRFSAKNAEIIFTGFPTKCYNLPAKKTVFSGQLLELEKQEKMNFSFGFKDKKHIILFTGGSLGALSLNKAVFSALPFLLSKYNIIHQTGSFSYNQAIEVRAKLEEGMRSSYFITDFLKPTESGNMMIEAMKISDLIVARAGATTIGEISLFEKPMILVPYPYASAGHQQKNADILAKSNAAVVITDKELSGEKLSSKIDKLFDSESELNKIAENAHKFFPQDGLKIVTEEILKEDK